MDTCEWEQVFSPQSPPQYQIAPHSAHTVQKSGNSNFEAIYFI